MSEMSLGGLNSTLSQPINLTDTEFKTEDTFKKPLFKEQQDEQHLPGSDGSDEGGTYSEDLQRAVRNITVNKNNADRTIIALRDKILSLKFEDQKTFGPIVTYSIGMEKEIDNARDMYYEAKNAYDRETGADKAKKEKAKKAYMEAANRYNLICTMHGINCVLLTEALSIDDVKSVSEVILGAVKSPFTSFPKAQPKDPDAFFAEAQRRVHTLRALLSTDGFRREVNLRKDYKEDLNAFMENQNKDIVEGRLTEEDAARRFSFDNPFRIMSLPEALRPKDETDRKQGVFHDCYDRMDSALINVNILNGMTADPAEGASEEQVNFTKTIQGMVFGFNNLFYMSDILADISVRDKKCTNDTRDDVMTELTRLSYDHGLLAAKGYRLIGVFNHTDKNLQSQILRSIEPMLQKFFNALPNDDTVRGIHDLKKLVDTAEKIMDEASVIMQFAEAMAGGDLTEAQLINRLTQKKNEKESDARKESQGMLKRYSTDWVKERARLTETRADIDRQIEEQKEKEETDRRNAEEEEKRRIIASTSTIESVADAIEEYIPQNEIQKLSEYSVGNASYKGVGKCSAYFMRKGFFIKDGNLTKGIEKHVDRFLRGRGITDRSVSKTADSVIGSAGLYSEKMVAFWKNAGNAAEKLRQAKQLMDAEDDGKLATTLKELRPSIGAFSPSEVSPDSAYCLKYPHAAKIIYLKKLLDPVDVSAVRQDDSRKEEFAERLRATKYNIDKLYQTITGSKDYQDALQDQIDKSVELPPSEAVNALYRKRDELADVAMLDIMGFSLNMDIKRTEEEIDIHNRVYDAKEVVMANVFSQNLIRANRKEITLGMLRTRFEGMKKSLSDAAAERERERIAGLEKATNNLPEYVMNVGGAFDEVLGNAVSRYITGRKKLKTSLKSCYGEDADYLTSLIKERLPKDAPGGISDIKNAGNLNIEQINGYITLIYARLKAYEHAVVSDHSKYFDGHREFRQMLLKMAVNGEFTEYSKETVKNLFGKFEYRKDIAADSMYIVSAGKKLDKPRLFFDLTKQKAATFQGDAINLRSKNRTGRMDEFDQAYKKIAEDCSIDQPLNFYEYAAEKGLTEVGAAETAYNKYIRETWKATALANVGNDTAKEALITEFISKVTNTYRGKHEYIYAGVAEMEQEGINAIGDVMYEKRTEFDSNLEAPIMRAYARKYAFTKAAKENGLTADDINSISDHMRTLYFSKIGDEEYDKEIHSAISFLIRAKNNEKTGIKQAIELKDERVGLLTEIENGVYRPVIPILLENEEFRVNLISMEQKEFDTWMVEFMPRVRDVMAEILRHPFTDQYLHAKKDEINELLFKNKTADIKTTLDLDNYDKNIGKCEFKKGMTIDSVIAAALEKSVDDAHKDHAAYLDEGNLVIGVLLADGPEAVLDTTKMDLYRQRVKDNGKALNDAIEEALLQHPDLTGEQKEISRVAIRHNERIYLYGKDQKDYKPKQRVLDWLMDFDKQRDSDKVIADDLKELKDTMEAIVDQKIEGRNAFVEFAHETENIRRATVARDDTDANYDLNAEAREVLSSIIRAKDVLPVNGKLDSFYSQILTRASYHASMSGADKAQAFVLKDLNILTNVINFHDTAQKYLTEKGYKYDQISPMLNGLFDLYGKMIIDAGYEFKNDDETLRAAFDKQFTGKHVKEFERYLSDDTGGYGFVSSERVAAEYNTFMGQENRDTFEDRLKGFKKNNEYEKLTAEERILFGHLIVQESGSRIPMSRLERYIQGRAAVSTQKSDVLMGFINGEELSPADYRQVEATLFNGKALNEKVFDRTMLLIDQIREVKQSVSFTLRQDEYDYLMK